MKMKHFRIERNDGMHYTNYKMSMYYESGDIFFAQTTDDELLSNEEYDNIKDKLFMLSKELEENELYDMKIIYDIENFIRKKKLKRLI